jgi:membrane protease YdiL (CAAX protease family)
VGNLPAGAAAPPRAVLPAVFALASAAALPSLLTWLYFVALSGEEHSDLLRKVVYAGGKVVQVALPLAFVLLWERRFPRPTWPGREGVALGLGFGLAVAAGMAALYFGWLRDFPLLRRTPTPVLAVLRNFGIDSFPGFLALAAFLSVANSLFEEYYFRWFIFGRMRPLLPLSWSVVLSALVFMAHHVILLAVYFPGQFWTAVAPLSLCIALGGGMWAWLYARTGSLYAPWLSHALIDVAILAIGWDLSQRAG